MYPDDPQPPLENAPNQPDSFSYNQMAGNPMMQTPIPNSTTILVLGIVSIVTACCCYGVVGIILSIIALSMAKKAKATYEAKPAAYTPASRSNVTTGRICAITGLAIGALAIILYIIIISMYGFSILTNPEVLQDMMRNA